MQKARGGNDDDLNKLVMLESMQDNAKSKLENTLSLSTTKTSTQSPAMHFG